MELISKYFQSKLKKFSVTNLKIIDIFLLLLKAVK